MEHELERKIIKYLKENKWVKSVTPTEVAHLLNKKHDVVNDALKSLYFQKRLYRHDIASKEPIGNKGQERKFPDAFYAYYLFIGTYEAK